MRCMIELERRDDFEDSEEAEVGDEGSVFHSLQSTEKSHKNFERQSVKDIVMKYQNGSKAPAYQSNSLAVDRLAYLAAGINLKRKSNTQSLIDKMKHESELKRHQNQAEEEVVVENKKVRHSIEVLLTEREYQIET